MREPAENGGDEEVEANTGACREPYPTAEAGTKSRIEQKTKSEAKT